MQGSEDVAKNLRRLAAELLRLADVIDPPADQFEDFAGTGGSGGVGTVVVRGGRGYTEPPTLGGIDRAPQTWWTNGA